MVSAPAYTAEVWKLPHEDPWGKILPRLKYTDLVCQIEKDDVGYGRIIFTGDDDDISKIIDIANDHGSIIRIFDDQGYNAHTFWSEFLDQSYEEQGQTVVHGPGIGNIADKMVVHPKDGLDEPAVERWIWDGNDSIRERTIDDLGEISAEWELWLDGERYGLSISATGGTWELAVPGHGTTTPLQWDASAGSIKSALEALTGITTVDVIKYEDDSYHIIFDTPKDLTSGDMTAASIDLTGGTADLTKQADGFDTSLDPTFTITVTTDAGADTTEALPWNASDNTLEGTSETLSPPGSGLQGLTNVDDVTVQGKGTYADRWVVTFKIPAIVTSVSITFAAGSSDALETEQGRLDPSPITKSVNPDASFSPHVHGTYGRPEIEIVTSPLNTDSDWTLLVRALTQFAGSQVLLGGLTPGQTYQASIPVYPTKTGKYRLVMRDESENLIKWTNATLTAGSYQVITVPDVVPTTEQVLFRIAVVSSSEDEIGDFYADWQHAKFIEGDPPTTIGDILQTIIAPIQERGVATWLDVSTFDAINTSGGVPWDSSTRGLEIPPGQTVLQLLDAISELWGYEWEIVWDDSLSSFALKVYNKEGMGTDRSGTLTFHPRQGWKPTVYQESLPPHTAVLGEANPGIWGYKEDLALSGPFGKLEGSLASQGVGLRSDSDVDDWLTADLETVKKHRFSARANLGARDDLRLGDQWRIGDKVNFAFSGTHIGTKTERINSVQLRVDSSDEQNVEYSLDYVKPVLWEPEAGTTSAPTSYMLNKLLRKFRRRIVPTTGGMIGVGGGGGSPTLVVAASNAHESTKERADLICSGIDDHLVIQAAIDTISDMTAENIGGRVLLTEGTFNIEPSFIFAWRKVSIQGMGRATVLKTAITNNANALLFLHQDCQVSDLIIDGSGGEAVGIDMFGINCTVSRVLFMQLDVAITGLTFGSVVADCISDGPIKFIEADSGGIDIAITGNTADGIIDLGGSSGVVTGNVMQSLVGGGSDLVIAGNKIDGGIDITGVGGDRIVIANNLIANTFGSGIMITGKDVVTIAGNTIWWASEHGIILTDCLDSVVQGNLMVLSPDIDNTYDGIHLAGASSRNDIWFNRIINANLTHDPRWGINISAATCEGNVLVHNDIRPAAAFDSGEINDDGTGTIFHGNIQESETGVASNTSHFSQSGQLGVKTGSFKLPFTLDATIVSVQIAVGVSPVGADLIVDVNKNGTTIFTTQANRPTVPDSDADGVGAETVPDVTSILEGEYLTVDVDQIGSTSPGEDLTVTVEWKPA